MASEAERVDSRMEPGADRDRVGLDALAVGQLDRGDLTVVARDHVRGPIVDDAHAGGPERVEFGVFGADPVVQDERQPLAELTEEHRRVQTHRVGDDLHDALVAHLVAVAERAVDDAVSPVLGQSGDVGQLVDEAGGGEHATGDHRVAAGQCEAEAAVAAAGRRRRRCRRAPRRRSGGPPRGRSLRMSDGADAVVAEVAVHVRGGSVARLAGVDDDHRSALPTELQRGGESGGRPADDGDIAVPLDGAWCVVTHGRRR